MGWSYDWSGGRLIEVPGGTWATEREAAEAVLEFYRSSLCIQHEAIERARKEESRLLDCILAIRRAYPGLL